MRFRNRWPIVVVLCSFIGALAVRWLPLWKLRKYSAMASYHLPDRFLPMPVRVLPPPDREYLGVWAVTPEEARRRLLNTYGFSQQIRAYLHAYERDGIMRYEAASCAYRPNGFFGQWQLHVRLFPAANSETAVWCHWERNPNVAPFAHLRQDGYDPALGKERLLALLDEALTIAK